MTALDNNAILSEEAMERIIVAVLARIETAQRAKVLRVREAKLAELRAYEDLHGIGRAIPSRREDGHGSKEDGYLQRDRSKQ